MLYSFAAFPSIPESIESLPSFLRPPGPENLLIGVNLFDEPIGVNLPSLELDCFLLENEPRAKWLSGRSMCSSELSIPGIAGSMGIGRGEPGLLAGPEKDMPETLFPCRS